MNTVLALCFIIFANDKPFSQEILRHEQAHIACPYWKHPKGMDPRTGKAYAPPKECENKRNSCDIVSVSTSEAIARCNGFLGTNSKMQYGCSGNYED